MDATPLLLILREEPTARQATVPGPPSPSKRGRSDISFDQKTVLPKNSEVGGYHVALRCRRHRQGRYIPPGACVRMLAGPLPVKQGPAAG
jgi:hypothetical protein